MTRISTNYVKDIHEYVFCSRESTGSFRGKPRGFTKGRLWKLAFWSVLVGGRGISRWRVSGRDGRHLVQASKNKGRDDRTYWIKLTHVMNIFEDLMNEDMRE